MAVPFVSGADAPAWTVAPLFAPFSLPTGFCMPPTPSFSPPLHMGAKIVEKPTILWFSLYFRLFSC
jgi:hypothetical protein